MNKQRNQPELMSPAGHWPQLKTAIEAGADAVYFGLNHFSARAKVGFSIGELSEVMRTLHERAVKGFVTFNTLVFDRELRLAEETIVRIAEAGADAIIVQDVGIAKLAHEIVPELDIHGSTQMSITSAEGAEFARALGCKRVVLGRELSLNDIRSIARQTNMELEVFVHGALCVSYSGQCFSSEAWGGRSANRGKCAQACRLSYDLIVDGHQRELGPHRYLLSPGDLCALEQVPELVDIGISCLKIEGRYKNSDYVALTTRAYREAIDMAVAGLPNEIDLDERRELEQIYSRGLGPHFISGVNHQKVVEGRAPRHRGVLIGQVAEVSSESVSVDYVHEVFAGDGLVFDAADWRSPDEPEEGGNVYEVIPFAGQKVQLKFGRQEIDFSRIRIGDLVWRTNDPRLEKKLKHLTASRRPVFTRGLRFEVAAKLGKPIEIKAITDLTETVTFTGSTPLVAAQNRSLDLDTLVDKLGRLGGTPFHLLGVEWSCEDDVFLPTSQLNSARRHLVAQLLQKRGQAHFSRARRRISRQILAEQQNKPQENGWEKPQIHLLVRTAEQLEAAIECRPASITLDYLELYGLRPSVEKIHSAEIVARVASPRILKPSEQKVVRFLLTLDAEILVRSAGLLQGLNVLRQPLPTLIGDFSLNAANALAVETFLNKGLARITPTYDLNAKQIEELTQFPGCYALEVIAFSHLPVFHTEHCVFCRFLSTGTDHTNCGHPCEKHRLAVRDSAGRQHPIMADVGCRNTVFGAEAQTDPGSLAAWQNAGIQHYRLEFVHQTHAQVIGTHSAFADFFAGVIDKNELGQKLAKNSPQKTTRGSLFVPADFKKLVHLS